MNVPMYRRAAAGGLLGCAMMSLLGACNKKEAEPPPVRPVLSLVIVPKSERMFGPFTGTVEPRFQTALGFRAAGLIVSRSVNVGDRVIKGQLLASLDPRLVRFSLESSKADLANAQATLVNAIATEQRQRTLIETESVSQAQVDSAVAARETAQAKVVQAQASLTKAQEQFDYTELHSDYDGVVTKWELEVGQVVTTGQTVVDVARPDIRDAVFDVPDDLIGQVPPGTVLAIALQSDQALAATGEVREIAPQADAATRTRRIRLTLKSPPEVFRLGTTVTITLANQEPPTITIPAGAVLDKDGQAHVWIVTPGKTVDLKPVTLGARQGDTVTVTAGLSAGDRMITAGVHSLSTGQLIKIVEP